MKIVSVKFGRAVLIAAFLAVNLTAGGTLPIVGELFAVSEASAQATRRTFPMGKKTIAVLESAQAFVEAEQMQQAISTVARGLQNPDLNITEKARLQMTLGSLHSDGNRKETVRLWQAALDSKGLDMGNDNVLRGFLGQVLVAEGQYRRAITLLEAWLATEGTVPNGQAYFLLGMAYYQQKNLDRAIRNILKAVQLGQQAEADAKAAGEEQAIGGLNKAWVGTLSGLYIQKGQYRKALPWAELMVARWTDDKQGWLNLSSSYSKLGRNKDFYATYKIMYRQNMLTGQQVEMLANQHLFFQVPVQAARLLDREIKKGTVKANKKNWELLGNSWLGAREWSKAVSPLTKAARASGDGKIWLQLGQTYLRDEKFPEAEKALTEARKKGVPDRMALNMSLGRVRFNQEKIDEALEAFAGAANIGLKEYEKTKTFTSDMGQTLAWIKAVDEGQVYSNLVARLEVSKSLYEAEQKKKKEGK
jgi:tetratricopeptide (TPR) repeat protein